MFPSRPTRRRLLGLGLLATIAAASAAQAADIHVPGDFPTITIAINNASDGDTIIIAPGNYFQPIDLGNKQISLIGSGGPEVTTINAFGKGSALRITGGQSLDTVIEGLTFTGGLAYRGAGVFINNASATIRNCHFINNHATLTAPGGSDPGDGGGLFIENGSLVLENCEFLANTAADLGGGAYVRTNTNVTMTACHFEGNIADRGAGMATFNGTASIFDSTFLMNGTTADTNHGGGLHIAGSNSNVLVDRSLFEGNAIFDDGFAVMARDGSQVELRNSLFLDNIGANGPTPNGTIYSLGPGTHINVFHCTLVGNSSTDIAAGLRTFGGGTIEFRNGIIWDNNGPAVAPGGDSPITLSYSLIQDLAVSNCCATIGATGCDNAACESLICSQDPFCCQTQWDSLCADAANEQCDVCTGGSDVSDSDGNISIDPMLDADLRPLPGSPVIDAADTTVLLGEDPRDFDMNPRAVNDPDTVITGIPVYGLTADMGAFEFQPEGGTGEPCPDPKCPETTCPGDINGDGEVNVFDLLELLGNWGTCPSS